MKNTIKSLILLTVFATSTAVFAGGVKNLIIEAEEAIFTEFFDNGLKVESIANHSFTSVKNGIGLKADVETINPESREPQNWTCVVTFQKQESTYFATDVDCK